MDRSPEEFLAPERIAQLRSRVDMKRAAPTAPAEPAGGDTVAIVAADAQGTEAERALRANLQGVGEGALA